MVDILEKINEDIEKIALLVVSLELEDIPSLGKILNYSKELIKNIKKINSPEFFDIISAFRGYVESLVLFEVTDFAPIEEGVEILQNIVRLLKNNDSINLDLSYILQKLGSNSEKNNKNIDQESKKNKKPEAKAKRQLAQEDIQIFDDFIVEAIDYLETIEINLVDLEENPDDKSIIDSIFRPFHTIKGVSGFLELNKINRLSHTTENLLDGIRQGNYKINPEIIDIILDSVDKLKSLIRGIEMALQSDKKNLDLETAIDVDNLIIQINEIESRSLQGLDKKIGDILLDKGSIKKEDLNKGLKIQKETPDKKIGEIFIAEKITETKNVISALREQKKTKRTSDLNVKVDINKLDNLVDQTGELVIAQAMIRQNQLITSLNDQKLYQNLKQLTLSVTSIQKIAMSLRMVPIKNTFQKMVRLVRDLAKNSHKKVLLEMYGEDTEIDRNVVEELYEPMVHMIRNSVDHGIEDPNQRQSLKKQEKGVINLRAYHQGGNIVIEIEDDGKGLNKDKLMQKALKNNLIDEKTSLTDAQIYDLIFHPGFSTAEKVTDISGRGVGMDVVKKGIEKLRGRIEIKSELEKGTTFVISLPLTLAIIDGMIVSFNNERYIVPTMIIREAFKPKKEEYFTVEGKGEMVMVRNNLIPLMRLNMLFGIQQNKSNSLTKFSFGSLTSEQLILVVEYKGEQRGVLIDELIGKEEVVIKNLGAAFKNIKGFAGCTILGDGRVGLILDIASLFELSEA